MSPEDDPDAIEVEWDSTKEVANQRKHGISFYEAATVFFDPLSLTAPAVEHSMGEQRRNIIGVSSEGELVVVTYTERQHRLRIISARTPTKSERRDYEEGS